MKIKKETLHLLILEDNPADAELAIRELEKEGFIIKWSLVETEEAFREALNQRPEVILADYNLPSFDGLSSPFEYRGICKDGEVRWVLETVTSVTYQGKRAMLGNFKDVTDIKHAEKELQQSYTKLQKTMEGTINVIVKIVEAKDPYTAGHQMNVSELDTAIAKEIELSPDRIEGIRIASLVHDIGKISLPAEILTKRAS